MTDASQSLSAIARPDAAVSNDAVADVLARTCPADTCRGQRVLAIVPDGTRTAPVGLVFRLLHDHLAGVVASLDVMIALGTHQPMSEEAICRRLDMTMAERQSTYRDVAFYNHEWDNPAALRRVGVLSADRIHALTDGAFSIDVPVEINRRVLDYDRIVIIGPVFPHEVVGFSGGNKYLFPGVSGPDILNFFHWLGAVVTNPMIIGSKWTPVRKVVDAAGALVTVPKTCFCLVVRPDGPLAGIVGGTPEAAWTEASELSRQTHIVYKDRPYHTVLSCVPPMYDDLWTGGKGMYKLEPVVADGGELIIYAPHISEVSVTHGTLLLEVGYHCRDYFRGQWDRFGHLPWGVLAHSTHVRGVGTYEGGVERCRIQVTVASQIPEHICHQINLGYRDPATIDVDAFANREDEGVLLVRKAGEMLYRLSNPPAWAVGS
ncbi:lactate racemase domain-containing protein [Luteitalea sp.]